LLGLIPHPVELGDQLIDLSVSLGRQEPGLPDSGAMSKCHLPERLVNFIDRHPVIFAPSKLRLA
jgi:hypothetical protein